MLQAMTAVRRPRWYWIPVRVVLVTVLSALLSFAIGLLLGILGTVVVARVHGIAPDMRMAYRYVALPLAVVVAAVALVSMTIMEVRHYRRAKVLAQLEQTA